MSKKDRGYSEEVARSELTKLLEAYNRYRTAMIALGVCCVGMLALSMGFYKGDVIDGEVQNMMIVSTYLFVGIMLFLAFAKVRPLKANIKDWNREITEKEINPSYKIQAPETGEAEDTKASKHPPTEEYKKLRRIWYACILIAVGIMFVSMFMIRANPDDLVKAMVVLLSSYIFIFIAVYYDRQKLKPLREQWKRQQEKARRKEARSRLKSGK